jgi:hypothetical protein
MSSPRRSHPVVIVKTNPQSEQPLDLRLVATNPFRRGEPATIRVIAEGGAGGYVYGLGKLSLPPGMGPIDPVTGISTGTPTTAGHYEFEIEVQDSSSTVWSERFTVDVVSRLTPGDVTPVTGEIGVPYSYQLTVRGATGTVTWKRISGTLPAGLTLPDNGPGVVSGTPTNPFGRSTATVRATDAGSGDTLDVAIVVNIVRAIQFVGPSGFKPELSFIEGIESWIDVSQYWRGGAAPFRIEPITPDVVPFGLRFVAQGDGRVLLGGIPVLPAGPPSQQWDAIFRVRDALGNFDDIPYALYINSSQGTIGGEMNGVSASQRSAPTINFIGSAVVAVTATNAKTTVKIDHPNTTGLSVLGRSTSTAGAPENIQATANDRVLARVGGALQWVQVTAAMHANSGAVAGTYDRVTVNLAGLVTGGAYAYGTIFTKNVTSAVQFFLADFAGMTTLTDVVRFTGTAAVTCSVREFFGAPRAGQTVMFVNASAATYTLTNQYTSGTNTSHFDIGADFNIAPGHNALLWYDGGSQRWRIVGAY